jgi:cytochrome c-type biogenesis protein CcmH/NrfG
MAIIPLRAYNREIESLIDNSQLDEAVAHCRHILATYPKHIATYRLLGKAHLEQQRISDATDIFQRVLSAIPDDFIANVGMSIIREDENNLDASIWHMELAYEAQPSNAAIQDELLRLYSRRDGMQPPKVRLTRGALARMYAKGGLFDQAIAELRAAIAEDPNRLDLQLLLAQMYFETSQHVEAVDTCANVLKKLPFCLVANQILAACLPGADRSDAGRNYRQTAITMDPYFAFANPEAVSSDHVPDNEVTIEKLEWKSGLQISGPTPQPTWATSLGISLEKPADEKLPDWIQNQDASTPTEPEGPPQSNVSPFIWDTQEVKNIISDSTNAEEAIPDWMRDAGWKPAGGKTQPQAEAIPETPVTPEPQEELTEKAEIPDWLRGIAPDGVLDDSPTSQSEAKDTAIPWLDKQQPGPTDSIIQWLEDKKPEVPATPAGSEPTPVEATDEEIPDWLKDLDVPFPAEPQEDKSMGETPAFLSDTPAFIEEPAVPETSKNEPLEIPPTEGTREPLEISEIQPAEPENLPPAEAPIPVESPAASSEEIPDWLRELAAEMPPLSSIEQAGEDKKDELAEVEENPFDEWISEQVPSTEPATSSPDLSVPESEAPVPETPEAELTHTLEDISSGLAPLLSSEEEKLEETVNLEEIPVKEELVEQPSATEEMPGQEEIIVEQEKAEETPTSIPTIEQPTALEEIRQEEVLTEEPAAVEVVPEVEKMAEEPVSIEQIPEQEHLAEIPAIEETAEGQISAEEVPESVVSAVAPISFEELPEIEFPDSVEEPIQAELPTAAEGEKAPEIEAAGTEAEAFAWLEGLAAQQGAKEEELITPLDERDETLPEWVKQEAEAQLDKLIYEQEPKADVPPAVPAEEMPEWIKGLGETPEEEKTTEELPPIPSPLPAEVTPEPAEPSPETPEPSPQPAAAVVEPEAPSPELEVAQPEPEVPSPEPAAPSPEPEAAPSEELPAWLLEIAETGEEKEATGEVPEGLEWREEELPAWLKELSEEEVATEGLLPPEPGPSIEEVPALQQEAVSEWTPEEEAVVELEPEVSEKLVEPQPLETGWVPEVKAAPQPVVTEMAGVEVEALEATKELPSKELEPPVAPPEQPVVAAIEEPDTLRTVLEEAWKEINQDHPAQAAELYSSLIKQNYHLDEMITDLQDALYRFPLDVGLWVSLGDAHLHKDDLQEALNAYTKAEELVR